MISLSIERLFSAYRRDDYADSAGFFAQLGAVFEGYPESVIDHVTSPRTGLQRTCKFPPSVAEVVEACEREAAEQFRSRQRQQQFAGRVAVPTPPRGPSMAQRLCAKYRIPGIPAGWDAVEVTKQAAKHVADFPRVVAEMLRAP